MLYLVPTPLGNLGDMSPRALEVLRSVDWIAAEDTRVTLKLLTHFQIKKPLISYYEHNREQRGRELIERLQNGETGALVTDAGTPAISDPGEHLVALCHEAGIPVSPLPGPCAAICALAASGFPTGRFCFEGFLSVNKKNRREHLAMLAKETRTMVFYEAPHKLPHTLADMLEAWGDRRLFVAREISKIHEECFTTTLSEALKKYTETTPKGEFVLVVEGAVQADEEKAPDLTELDLTLPPKELMKQAKAMGLSRNEAYKLALEAKKNREDA